MKNSFPAADAFQNLLLTLGKLSFAGISMISENSDCMALFRIPDQEVPFPEQAKSWILISLNGEERTLEWNCSNTGVRQNLQNLKNAFHRCKICTTGLVQIGPKRVLDVLGNHVRGDPAKGMAYKAREAMVRGVACKQSPIDAAGEHVTNRRYVCFGMACSGACKKEPKFVPH